MKNVVIIAELKLNGTNNITANGRYMVSAPTTND